MRVRLNRCHSQTPCSAHFKYRITGPTYRKIQPFNFSNKTITLLLPVRHLLYAYISSGPDRKDKGDEPSRKAKWAEDLGPYIPLQSLLQPLYANQNAQARVLRTEHLIPFKNIENI
ncbi:hypothetical protein PspLS_11805 [Pyricularia sp. CBS 133598]|nr:hypothetical protein PspLS_11805 [Pyricularia sp. CBS 133598]